MLALRERGQARGKGEERDAKSSNASPLLKLKNALYHREHVLHPSGNIQRRVFVSRESKPFGSPVVSHLATRANSGLKFVKYVLNNYQAFVQNC